MLASSASCVSRADPPGSFGRSQRSAGQRLVASSEMRIS